jgi:phage shock protein A
MTEQEAKAIEESIDVLVQTISILTQQKTALEERIAVLEATRTTLTQLHPPKPVIALDTKQEKGSIEHEMKPETP